MSTSKENNTAEESGDNIADQRDEVDALRSIYGDNFRIISTEGESKGYRWIYEIQLSDLPEELDGLHVDYKFDAREAIILRIKIPSGYPSDRSPECEIYGNNVSKETCASLVRKINARFGDGSHGQVVVFDRLQFLQDLLMKMDLKSKDEIPEIPQPNSKSQNSVKVKEYNILSTEPVTDRKSKFQGHYIFPVIDYSDLDDSMLYLSTNVKKIDTATHNMRAWRFKRSNGVVEEGYKDDGEKEAGRRMLFVMQQCNVMDSMIVITRWYGGVHLGPDRFKHIMVQTRAAIDLFLPSEEEGEGKKVVRRKGKKGKR